LPHIKDIDLLYHESTFLDAELERATETYHSTAKQAATIAQKADAKRLILGHFSSRYKDLSHFKKEAETIFNNVSIPSDGDVFVIE